METRKETIKTEQQFRHFAVNRDGINAESRTVELAFSSEEPYRRWFGIEILDHSGKSADLSRLNNRHPLLLDHNPSKQIGVIESARIDGDKVGRAVVRFGNSPLAQEVFQDVQDGIRSHVSVGYIVNKMVLESEAKGEETYRVTDWQPLEVSLVSIPADPTVGVGRSAEQQQRQYETEVEKPTPPANAGNTKGNIMTTEANAAAEQAARAAGEQAALTRINSVLKLGEQYAKYDGHRIAQEVLRSGGSTEEFLTKITEKITAKHSDVRQDVVDLTPAEVKRWSLSRAVLASLGNDWKAAGFEREVSDEIAKKTGQKPEGFYMPLSVLNKNVADVLKRDFNVGTAAEAGNLVQTTVMMDEFVDVLRNYLVMGRLGATMLYGLTSNIGIPRKTSAGAISNVTEIAAFTETQPNTTLMTLSPKRVGAFVEPSKQAIQQVNASVDAMLQKDLVDGLAVQIENLAFNGTGTAPQPRGIIATAGIGAVVGGTNGAQFNWGHMVSLESACANANSEPDIGAGYAFNTRTRGWLKTVQKATNLPFIWDVGNTPVNGYRAGVTNNLPNNGTKGTSSGVCSTAVFSSNWADLIIGYFGGLDVVVDPYSLATTGQVRITINQFFDTLVRQPASFAAMTDGLTA